RLDVLHEILRRHRHCSLLSRGLARGHWAPPPSSAAAPRRRPAARAVALPASRPRRLIPAVLGSKRRPRSPWSPRPDRGRARWRAAGGPPSALAVVAASRPV